MTIRRLVSKLRFALALALVATAPIGAAAQTAQAQAQGQAQAPPQASAPSAEAKSYVLGPEDVLEVTAIGHDDFTSRVKISARGVIQLPYIGDVIAANKTPETLSADITKALVQGGYFAKPIVRVEIASYASRYVTVLGDVVTPGLVPVDRPYHLSDILARVGGTRQDGADYVVLTPQAGPSQRISIQAMATGDAAQDPLVAPGDKIYNPPAEIFYISGQVHTPGAYPLAPNLTLRMAISRGGGLTDLGSDRSVKVTRGGKTLTHFGLNDPIQAGDVILIGERLF
jgi:polysaccharide export outer membrane protein